MFVAFWVGFGLFRALFLNTNLSPLRSPKSPLSLSLLSLIRLVAFSFPGFLVYLVLFSAVFFSGDLSYAQIQNINLIIRHLAGSRLALRPSLLCLSSFRHLRSFPMPAPVVLVPDATFVFVVIIAIAIAAFFASSFTPFSVLFFLISLYSPPVFLVALLPVSLSLSVLVRYICHFPFVPPISILVCRPPQGRYFPGLCLRHFVVFHFPTCLFFHPHLFLIAH